MTDVNHRNRITENLRGLKNDIDAEDDFRFATIAKAGTALADVINVIPGIDAFSAAAAIHESVQIEMTARLQQASDNMLTNRGSSDFEMFINSSISGLVQMYAAAVLLGV